MCSGGPQQLLPTLTAMAGVIQQSEGWALKVLPMVHLIANQNTEMSQLHRDSVLTFVMTLPTTTTINYLIRMIQVVLN